MTTLKEKICIQAKKVKIASDFLKTSSLIQRNNALQKMSEALIKNIDIILNENKKDIIISKKNKSSKTIIDRLLLTKSRIENIAINLQKLISLNDPLESIVKSWKTKEELEINLIKVPLGVIGMIFEARPNVVVDSVGLAIKSGNSIILKGSSSANYSNRILVSILSNAIKDSGLPKDSVQLIDSTNRKSVDILISMKNYLDVVIPRGGKELIKYVASNSKIPIIETGIGVCHCYIDKTCDLDMAIKIIVNGKLQRPSVCNSLETILIHEDLLDKISFKIEKEFSKKKVEIRACQKSYKFFKKAKKAKKNDFGKEFLDYIVAIKSVKNIKEAINHINSFGSKHSEVIITNDYTNIKLFQKKVDAACIFINASTRFADGESFGFGAEMGISTQKIHTRGPMGLDSLTTIKYLINGNGQIRK